MTLPYGFEIYVNNLIQPYWSSRQVKFPKSKKSRIRKKWHKNKANWKDEYHNEFIVIGNKVFMNQENYDKLISI